MAVRDIPLTVLKGGINRLRVKGKARADSLYDLHNGHLTTDGTAQSRPGTVRVASLPDTTRGLCAFRNLLHVFSHQTETVPDGFVNNILFHPENTPELVHTIVTIHFAQPFLGFLYVAAEFDDGQIFHFWVQSDGEWTANTIYHMGDVFEPTTPNGLRYRATRLGPPNPVWAPRVPRTVGDRVEPTEASGFYFEVVDTVGANPASGDVEPTWPTEEGGLVMEDTEGVLSGNPSVPPVDSFDVPSSGVIDRYGSGQ